MKFRVLLSVLLAITLTSLESVAQVTAAPRPLDMTPTTVRFGYITGIAFPTFIVAEDLGFFKSEGITIEKVFLNGSGAVSEALAAGNIDMGNTAPTANVLATSRGARTVAVCGYEYTFTDKSGKSWEAVYVVVRSGEGIRTLDDLKGKRIAVNDYGSTYNYLLREYFLKAGSNPDKDVTIMAMPFSQMAGALVQKQVDAIIAVADGYAQARQRIPVDVIGTHTSLEGLDVGLSSMIGVSTNYLEKNPDVVVRFLRAMLKARLHMNESIAAGRTDIKDVIAKNMKYTPERSDFFWETRGAYYGKELEYVNLLDIPRRLIARQYEVLKAVNLVRQDNPGDYDKAVNIQPLRRAYDSLGLKWNESRH